jgi:ubiquitin carboxyl-terminal hydrolase L5
VLLNVPAEGAGDVDLGGDLRAFREFSLAFDAESKGLAIGNSDRIRLSHNSFARRDAFMIEQTQQDKKKGEAHHFVAYVPHQGAVFELDGLKAGPILLGPIPGGEGAQQGDWLEVARPAVAARMARYSASETHFALMSIRKSLASALTKEISVLEARVRVMEAVSQSGEGFGQSVIEEGGETFQLAADFDGLEVQQADARARLQALRSDAAEEERRIQRQREENVRRRHNYVPLASALLGALAARRHEGSGGSWLDEMRRQAESRASTRRTLLNSKSK